MRTLPPPPGAELDLGEGFPFAARQVIDEGERALVELRKNSVKRWISAGAAWKALQQAAMYRSRSNSPAGPRYHRTHAILVHSWPQLAKVDKATRSNAIWLFEHEEPVLTWLATLSQKERDQWTHPAVIRRHFEKRHPGLGLFDMSKPRKPRPTRTIRVWNRQRLGERSREELEAAIAELVDQLADRDRYIDDLEAQLAEKDRLIAQLQTDVTWERVRVRQLESSAVPPGAATVIRPDGEIAEIVHAISRQSQEVSPPLSHGHPDYAAWAKEIESRIDGGLSGLELHWLRDDNAAHLDAYETAFRGAGVALKDRINRRIAELD